VHPELFAIPMPFGWNPFTVAWYGVLITLGVLIGAIVAQRMAEKRGLNANLLSDMTVWVVAWGVIGARIMYIATSPGQFIGTDFFHWINIRQGGISIHGGVIAGILVILYYQRRYKINFYHYADLMVPGLALGVIGGRIGNFFNGSDTMGRVTNWPIGFTWPEIGSPILGIFKGDLNWAGMPGLCLKGEVWEVAGVAECSRFGGQMLRGPVHLTQIYGAVIGLILVVASIYWLRSKRPGWATWQFILWYSLLRSVFEETFRLNPLTPKIFLSEGANAAGIGLLTATQLASIPLVILSIYMLVRISRRPLPPETSSPVLVPSGGPSSSAQGA
jgi:phosphatidylglycerol---prolipoprotein diacylglyceryl transferase